MDAHHAAECSSYPAGCDVHESIGFVSPLQGASRRPIGTRGKPRKFAARNRWRPSCCDAAASPTGDHTEHPRRGADGTGVGFISGSAPAPPISVKKYMARCFLRNFHKGTIPHSAFAAALAGACGLTAEQANGVLQHLIARGHLGQGGASTRDRSTTVNFAGVIPGFLHGIDESLRSRLSYNQHRPGTWLTEDTFYVTLSPMQRSQVRAAVESFSHEGGAVLQALQTAVALKALRKNLPKAIRLKPADYQERWVKDTTEGRKLEAAMAEADVQIQALTN